MVSKIDLASCNSPLPEGCPQDGVLETWLVEHTPTSWVFEPDYFQHVALEESPTFNWALIFKEENSAGCYTINQRLILHQPITALPFQRDLKQRARTLRKAGNLPEVLFWIQVTKNRFHKIDFDRQRVIGNYIVDFYVKKLGLVIEIDGNSHAGKEVYDKKREDYLTSLGLRVYRIKVGDIMGRIGKVMAELEDYMIENYGVKVN